MENESKPVEKEVTLTEEQVAHNASYVQMICNFASALDLRILKKSSKEIKEMRSSYDTMAVVNRKWSHAVSELYSLQGESIDYLVKFIETIQKISEQKLKVESEDQFINSFDQIFPR